MCIGELFSKHYNSHKEEILYLFFGGCTFFVAIGVYYFLNSIYRINALLSNFISWLVGVTFSFFTNRKWVFESDIKGTRDIFKQMLLFYGMRVATLLLQELLLFIFISKLCFPSLFIKISTEFINILLNYFASKWIIFKK